MSLPPYVKKIDDLSELEAKALLIELRSEVTTYAAAQDFGLSKGVNPFWLTVYDLFEEPR